MSKYRILTTSKIFQEKNFKNRFALKNVVSLQRKVLFNYGRKRSKTDLERHPRHDE